jgi:hypothetical protein
MEAPEEGQRSSISHPLPSAILPEKVSRDIQGIGGIIRQRKSPFLLHCRDPAAIVGILQPLDALEFSGPI